MKDFPIIKPKKLVSILTTLGFQVYRQKGSHVILKSGDGLKRVTIPIHNKDLKRKTTLSILKQSGLTKDDLMKK